jgi:hypothetical protein
MIGAMKLLPRLRWASLGALVAGSLGCASSQPAPVASARPAALTVAATSARQADAPAPRKFGKGPTLDRQGCEPTGKATMVEKKGPDGVVAWRYFAVVKRGVASVRVLKCEAVDNNGDGYVDARFFYDDRSNLVLEQRDLDFDGHAEVIADYSHFSSGHLVQAD